MASETCQGTTRKGTRCRNPAGPSGYCPRHPPPPGSPPADLDEEARELWAITQAHLETEGSWRAIDRALLERYVRAGARARMARAELPASPWVKGSMGQVAAHPAIALERQAERDAHEYARQLGLLKTTDDSSGDDDPAPPVPKDLFDL